MRIYLKALAAIVITIALGLSFYSFLFTVFLAKTVLQITEIISYE